MFVCVSVCSRVHKINVHCISYEKCGLQSPGLDFVLGNPHYIHVHVYVYKVRKV